MNAEICIEQILHAKITLHNTIYAVVLTVVMSLKKKTLRTEFCSLMHIVFIVGPAERNLELSLTPQEMLFCKIN